MKLQRHKFELISVFISLRALPMNRIEVEIVIRQSCLLSRRATVLLADSIVKVSRGGAGSIFAIKSKTLRMH